MVADGDAVCRGTDRLDDAGGLVAEHNRHRIAQLAFDDFEIGVT